MEKWRDKPKANVYPIGFCFTGQGGVEKYKTEFKINSHTIKREVLKLDMVI